MRYNNLSKRLLLSTTLVAMGTNAFAQTAPTNPIEDEVVVAPKTPKPQNPINSLICRTEWFEKRYYIGALIRPLNYLSIVFSRKKKLYGRALLWSLVLRLVALPL